MDLQNPTTSIKHSRVLSKMDARQREREADIGDYIPNGSLTLSLYLLTVEAKVNKKNTCSLFKCSLNVVIHFADNLKHFSFQVVALYS